MNVHSYSIRDIETILYNGISYQLPESVVATIAELSKMIGGTVSESTEKDGSKYKPSYSKTESVNKASNSSQDWDSLRSFKTTKIDVKNGIEKDINLIRSGLNKISVKNYAAQRDFIIQHVKTFIDSQTGGQDTNPETKPEETQINIRRIAQSIFDIASNNKPNSELYANLYGELIQQFSDNGTNIFSTILMDFVSQFKYTIDVMQHIDPNVDYDAFCDYTKKNDTRKSTTLFLVNLAKGNTLSLETILDLIECFQEKILKYVDEPQKTNEVEELIENVFIFITQSVSFLRNEPRWANIMEKMGAMTKMKSKDHPSFTNRALFKCMDTADFIAKFKPTKI
jgi:hypothetical protein